MRLADDQLQQLLDALTPLASKIQALEIKTQELSDDKADKEGEINIEGEVDGVPAEISGLYEIIDVATTQQPAVAGKLPSFLQRLNVWPKPPVPQGPTNRPWRHHPPPPIIRRPDYP